MTKKERKIQKALGTLEHFYVTIEIPIKGTENFWIHVTCKRKQ